MNQPALTRSQTDNMLGGVAGGLADYLNIDPVFVRLFFILTVLYGHGIGLLLYLILYLLMPAATPPEKFETA